MTGLGVPLGVLAIFFVVVALLGFWFLDVLVAILFGVTGYYGWRVGRRGAGWK